MLSRNVEVNSFYVRRRANSTVIRLEVAVEINGLKLPASFLSAIHQDIFRREFGSWPLKQGMDAYGHPLETELAEVYVNREKILVATTELSEYWKPDGCYGAPGESADQPGFIPDIIDFSQIVSFGMSADGAPFCFDFRDDAERPSVIWWADVYWTRIAPDFEAFVELFDLRSVFR
jgi:hypothetical protein